MTYNVFSGTLNPTHSLTRKCPTTPVVYTATDTMTDLANMERAGNRQQDAMLPF